ncbi:MAG: SDR family NAD(P)-dependent oxidoreductase [Candidatus Omnitrophica bacterium]|nr:SDR family NAD(P)-dependent oxidoreductase [Candidatus Omnitrophota bacterium]
MGNIKNVLVTGGAGFIGSNIVQAYAASGARVTVYDNLDPKSGANLYNLQDVMDRVTFVQADILDAGRIESCIQGQDIVIHCAALTSHGQSMRAPMDNLEVNVRGTLHVLEAIRSQAPHAVLVHLGTSTQLGALHGGQGDERSPEFPLDLYSANKTAAEKYVLIYGKHYGMRVAVARISNVYGPRAAIHTPALTFNNYFVGQALQGRDITVYGDGRQLRNFIYVDDVVSAVMCMASGVVSATDTPVFLVTGDVNCSVRRFAEDVVDVIGNGRLCSVPWPEQAKAGEVGDVILSNARMRSVFGWQPKIALKEGLSMTRDFYRTCLDKYVRSL